MLLPLISLLIILIKSLVESYQLRISSSKGPNCICAISTKLRKGLNGLLESTSRDFLARMDLYKFKDGVDPWEVIRLLTLAAEGMMARTNAYTAEEIETLFLEYKKYADMLRTHLYKEEYL